MQDLLKEKNKVHVQIRKNIISDIERALRYLDKGFDASRKKYRKSKVLSVVLRPILGILGVWAERASYESIIKAFLVAHSIITKLLIEINFKELGLQREEEALRTILDQYKPEDVLILFREGMYSSLMEKIERFREHVYQILTRIKSV